MADIRGVLDPDVYGVAKTIGIMEDKQFILESHGLADESQMILLGIDSRLLSVFCTSLSDDYSGFIVVYDYNYFCMDGELMEAIIWHEIGHLSHPVLVDTINIEAEIACDRMALENSGLSGILSLLQKTKEMGTHLGNRLLVELTDQRLNAIFST
ncbi:hypothetical protein V1498_10920 [Peribacillus sp. SCS-26]|uniref:hypothetical protein n=1 Tax=Paraperibacillus marinus TaxID=3115295 RepID=UPI003905ADFD